MGLATRFRTVLHALGHHAADRPGHLALTAGEAALSYAQLLAEVEGRAGWLVGQGVGQRDLVMIAGDNTMSWLVNFLAVMRVGAIAVPVNNRLAPKQVEELVAFLGARLALADGSHAGLFESCGGVRVVDTEAEATAERAGLPELPRGEDTALLSFTSGTTGVPKGAVISHHALLEAGRVFQDMIEGDGTTSTLIVAPLFHNTGFVDQLATMLICGGRIDLLHRFRTTLAIEQARRRSTTFLTAVPSVIRMMMLADGADAIFGPARDVLYGGSSMPRAWIDELLHKWPHLRLWHGYGLTEFTSCCTYLPHRLVREHGESIGYPAPGVELRLVGEDGEDVPDGEAGEIWVAGATRMTEYWGQPDQTSGKISGRWLLTGDLAVRREKGLLYHVGRKDDVINRGGEKILPSFVESVLAGAPGVGQASVFAIPNPVLHNSVIAAVEPRDGEAFDRDTAFAALRAGLPDYAVPEDIFVRSGLPRTGSGKLDRKAIRSLYLDTIKSNARRG